MLLPRDMIVQTNSQENNEFIRKYVFAAEVFAVILSISMGLDFWFTQNTLNLVHTEDNQRQVLICKRWSTLASSFGTASADESFTANQRLAIQSLGQSFQNISVAACASKD